MTPRHPAVVAAEAAFRDALAEDDRRLDAVEAAGRALKADAEAFWFQCRPYRASTPQPEAI